MKVSFIYCLKERSAFSLKFSSKDKTDFFPPSTFYVHRSYLPRFVHFCTIHSAFPPIRSAFARFIHLCTLLFIFATIRSFLLEIRSAFPPIHSSLRNSFVFCPTRSFLPASFVFSPHSFIFAHFFIYLICRFPFFLSGVSVIVPHFM